MNKIYNNLDCHFSAYFGISFIIYKSENAFKIIISILLISRNIPFQVRYFLGVPLPHFLKWGGGGRNPY